MLHLPNYESIANTCRRRQIHLDNSSQTNDFSIILSFWPLMMRLFIFDFRDFLSLIRHHSIYPWQPFWLVGPARISLQSKILPNTRVDYNHRSRCLYCYGSLIISISYLTWKYWIVTSLALHESWIKKMHKIDNLITCQNVISTHPFVTFS